jgi:Oxidoreductase family, NAD-binding Rossmann fold
MSLVGYGSIARVHHPLLNGRPDTQVTAVVSRQPPKLLGRHALARVAGSNCRRGRHRLAVLCSPVGRHAEQALICLQAGTHVVVETRPLTLDIPPKDVFEIDLDTDIVTCPARRGTASGRPSRSGSLTTRATGRRCHARSRT